MRKDRIFIQTFSDKIRVKLIFIHWYKFLLNNSFLKYDTDIERFRTFSRVALKLVYDVLEWTRVPFHVCKCMRACICICMEYTTLERRVETAPWMLTWAKAWLSRQWSIARLLPRKAHPYAQGWKETKKRNNKERREEEREREKKREKEEGKEWRRNQRTLSYRHSLTTTLLSEQRISRLLYEELFPAAFAQNENKCWWNLLNCRLEKRGTVDRKLFFHLLSTLYVKISNFT